MFGMNMLMQMLPYLIVIVVVIEILKVVLKKIKDWGVEAREKETKTEDERLYKAIVNLCKKYDLKKHEDVYLRGDSNIPKEKIGETATGVLPTQEMYIIPVRKKWWKFWQKATLVCVLRENIVDMYEGDLVIDGAGLDPLTEKFTLVYNPQEFGEETDDKEIQRKKLKIFEKYITRRLDFDMNNDIAQNTKTGMRGSRISADKELIRPERPQSRPKSEVQREQKRKEREIEKSERSRSIFNRSGY